VHIGVRVPRHAFDFLDMRAGLRSARDLLTGNIQTVELKPDMPAFVDVPAYSAVVLQL